MHSRATDLSLKVLLREQAEHLLHRLRGRQTNVSVDTSIDSVKAEADEAVALAALLQILQATEIKEKKSRATLIACGAAIVAVVSILAFIPTPTTEIALDIATTDLTFSLATEQSLFYSSTVSSLSADGFSLLEFPLTNSFDRESIAGSGQGSSFKLDLGSGSFALNSVTLPAATEISIASASGGRWIVTLTLPKAHTLTMEIPVRGSATFVVSGAERNFNETRTYDRGRVVRLTLPRTSILTIDPAPETRLRLNDELVIERISFGRVQQSYDESMTPRVSSGLMSGMLYLEALNGKAFALRPFDHLRFSDSRGVLRYLFSEKPRTTSTSRSDDDPKDRAFAAHFSGLAQGITLGSKNNTRTLMPTLLEWLLARQPLWLFWGSLVTGIGLANSFLRWLQEG